MAPRTLTRATCLKKLKPVSRRHLGELLDAEETCGICTDEFIYNIHRPGELSAVRLHAVEQAVGGGHCYHLGCITTWLSQPGCNTCPACRHVCFEEDDEMDEEEEDEEMSEEEAVADGNMRMHECHLRDQKLRDHISSLMLIASADEASPNKPWTDFVWPHLEALLTDRLQLLVELLQVVEQTTEAYKPYLQPHRPQSSTPGFPRHPNPSSERALQTTLDKAFWIRFSSAHQEATAAFSANGTFSNLTAPLHPVAAEVYRRFHVAIAEMMDHPRSIKIHITADDIVTNLARTNNDCGLWKRLQQADELPRGFDEFLEDMVLDVVEAWIGGK